MNKNESINRLLHGIESQVMTGQKYFNFDSDVDRDYNGDESVLDFDTTMNLDGEDSVLSMHGDRTKRGLSEFSINLVYTAGATSLPVEVELFGLDFNNGLFVGDDLVFSNAGGDTVTISGRTTSFKAIMNRAARAPMEIDYARIKPVTATQFDRVLKFRKDTIFGGGKDNTLLPDSFLTPEQFQLLRVDVPMNYKVDSERRIIMDVGPDQIGAGMVMIFFFNKVVNVTNELAGKPATINMKGRGLLDQPSISTRDALNQLIKLQVSAMKKKPFFLNR